LIKKITNNKKNEPIEIWGTGKAKREAMHVDDLSSAIYFILKKKLQNNKKLLNHIEKSPVINVGSGQEFTIKKFAKIISKILDNKNNLKFNKNYPDGTMRKILDNTIIKKLGWLPKINLNNGLTQTIKWYKSNYIKKN